jgi:RHS repeat-associated protein
MRWAMVCRSAVEAADDRDERAETDERRGQREAVAGDRKYNQLNGTRVELSCPSPSVQYGAQSFPQGSDDKYSFDARGRAVNHVAGSNTFRTVQAPPHSTTNKNWSVTTTTSSTYDAENHLHAFHPVKVTTITDADTFAVTTTTVDHGAATLGWGPTAHPVTVQNLWNGDNLQPDTTLHWDGDVLLFVTNSSGTVVDFKIGIDGEISPTDAAFTGLIAFDRDQAGMVLQCNSASGSSGFANPDDTTFAAGLPCGPGGPGFTAPIRSYFSYIRTDGISGLPVQINGVRAYDPTLGTWTTPDAFEGDIHDPASQQRYMWNRGNPVDYSDPSGYNPWWEELGAIVIRALRREPLFGSSTSQLERGLTTSSGKLTTFGARVTGTLREIPLSRGNFGIGSVGDVQQAKALGDIWVGPGSKSLSNGLGKNKRRRF